MRCEKCTAPIPDGASSCPACGAVLPQRKGRETADPSVRITGEDLAPKPSERLSFRTSPSVPAKREAGRTAQTGRALQRITGPFRAVFRKPGSLPGLVVRIAAALACLVFTLGIGALLYMKSSRYGEAYALYRAGRYEEAYYEFYELGDHLNSREMSIRCIRDFPETGVMEQFGETGTVKVSLRNNTKEVLCVALYKEDALWNEVYWGTVWAGETGDTAEILLPEGRYVLYGSTGYFWFGPVDRFGENTRTVHLRLSGDFLPFGLYGNQSTQENALEITSDSEGGSVTISENPI